MNRCRLFTLSVLAVAALTLTTAPFAHAQRTAGNAGWLRVVHASPDAPAVDIWFDDQPLLTGVDYAQFNNYVEVPGGNHRLTLAPAGAGADQAVVSTSINIGDDKSYTVVALGTLGDPRALVLEDERAARTPLSTDARLRIVHAVPGGPNVDILRADQSGPGRDIVTNVGFAESTRYHNVGAGRTTVRIEPVGSDTELATLPDVEFERDGVYTLVLLPTADGQALQGVWLSDRTS
jgi:Domain of unknown function (DUF4397)